MYLFRRILSGLLAISFVISCTPEKKENTKPNVIIIYADDQGAIDLNSFGAKDLVTPNMDKLVNSGIKFTQFYVITSYSIHYTKLYETTITAP